MEEYCSSAAQAAQAAQAASSTGTSSADGTEGILSKDRARLIPRPRSFALADRKQEPVQWKDWHWTLLQYLVVVAREFQKEIEQIESNLSNEVDWDLMGKAEQDRSRFLYSLLGSLIQGRLVGVVKNVENFNGYETLRQLLSNCQPQVRNHNEPAADDHGLLFIQHDGIIATTDLEA